MPDAVPLEVLDRALVARDAVAPCAHGVGREKESVPSVSERIEKNLEVILGHEKRVAAILRPNDPVGLGVPETSPDQKDVTRVDDADFSALRGGLSGARLRLNEAGEDGRTLPKRLAQHTVDAWELLDHTRVHRELSTVGGLCRECGGDNDNDKSDGYQQAELLFEHVFKDHPRHREIRGCAAGEKRDPCARV